MRMVPLTELPELLREYRPDLNGGLNAELIGKTDRRQLNWECSSCSTIWKARLNNRVKGQEPCPNCSSKFAPEESLAYLYPDLAKIWEPSINEGLTAFEVRARDWKKEFNWTCGKPNHIYVSTVGEKVRSFERFGSLSCPVCLNRTLIGGVNDLESQFPELSRQWDFEKNGSLTPDKVTFGSDQLVWWKCNLAHSWSAKVGKRAQDGYGCPACSGRQIVPGFNDFATLRPDAALEWDFEKNDFAPSEVTLWSSRTAHWKCIPHGHEWSAKVSKRSAGHGCHICKNRTVHKGFNDLETRFPLLALEFDIEKNGITPDQVMANDSTNRFWWRCSEGHLWQQLCIVRQNRGCGDCTPLGFKPSLPSKLYFIHNPALAARKIGITNIEAKEVRVSKFVSQGWRLIHTVEYITGHEILALEKQALSWLRKTCELPQFLGPEEMSQTGGWTETFSEDGPSNGEVVSQIKTFWNLILNA